MLFMIKYNRSGPLFEFCDCLIKFKTSFDFNFLRSTVAEESWSLFHKFQLKSV